MLAINAYVDPGVYFGQVPTPGAVNLISVPFTLAIIAPGNRNKRISNEAVQRGAIENETLTVSGSAPYTATLISRGDRKVANTIVFKDGIPVSVNAISFGAASVQGTAAGPFDLSTSTNTRAFNIELDGNVPLTIQFTYNASPAAFPGNVTVTGTFVDVQAAFSGVSGNAALEAEVITAINQALQVSALVALGYGPSYSSVAATGVGGIKLTSPLSTPPADVQVFSAIAEDGCALLFGSTSLLAATKVVLDPSIYNAGSVYTIDYVSVSSNLDQLANNNVQSIVRVGTYSNTGDFGSDSWSQSGNAIDWSTVEVAASVTGTIAAPFNLTTNDTIVVGVDGDATISVKLANFVGTPPLGWTAPATVGAATADEVVKNINAILANSVVYGPRYLIASKVTVSGQDFVKLTSITKGVSSLIDLQAPGSNSATAAIFGPLSLPYEKMGTGRHPVIGSFYFATYDFTRPASEYNVPIQSRTPDQAFTQVGTVSQSNPLAVAAELAFLNSAPSIFTVQVNDQSSPGSPTRQEILNALVSTEATDNITDVCVLDTRLSVQTDLVNHIETQNSPQIKHWRRGWFGAARNTPIGDPDTPNSLVWLATRTFNVAPTSPARGRLILTSPPNVSRTITDVNLVTTKLQLNSTYLSVAIAAKMTSFTSPADTLAAKTVTAFDLDDFQVYLRQERGAQASQGVTVVTLDGGLLKLKDPKTTEQGGVPQYQQISASTQKDNLLRKLDLVLDTNLVGVVPSDLADFIIDVKGFIGQTIGGEIGNGSIGPYVDSNKRARPINLLTDVNVDQDANDPTKFNFQFFFNLRYPALRFFGEFSTDNPFFGG